MNMSQIHETQAMNDSTRNLGTALPTCRSQWPSDARRAFSGVLGDLNSWCREYDWPVKSNARVAEEAVRRTWDSASSLV